MIPFIPAVLSSTGVVTILANGTLATTWMGAQGETSVSPIGSTAAVGATDEYSGGVAYAPGGEIRLVDATAGLPAGSVVRSGFAVNAGRLCYTTAAPDTASVKIGPVAVTQDGRVHAVITP